MVENVLKVQQLKVAYGGIKAVKGIDLEVNKGELITLIGANGAGKTTTLKAITAPCPAVRLRGKFCTWGLLSAVRTPLNWSLNIWQWFLRAAVCSPA